MLGAALGEEAFGAWAERWWPIAAAAFSGHGRAEHWEAALAGLPPAPAATLEAGDVVTLRANYRPSAAELHGALMALAPWRKGPFDFFGVLVDAEWRSDLKWRRVLPHLAPLAGRRVLDVGCGNGYYAWRMLGAGAACVLGLDPGLLAVAQFRAAHRYLPHLPAAVLPLASAALDGELGLFDTVFSMGVLYHRRDPVQHLRELGRTLAPGGELVLETLVIDVAADVALVPEDRYARMRNVWSVPSPTRVERWLQEAGLRGARCVDLARTTPAEQRTTGWMPFQSLADFLDPSDPARTVEGYPAPLRGLFLACTD